MMYLKLIKLAKLIPGISDVLYKIAGVKEEAVKRFPQFENEINELSNRGIEDSFLFSAIKLLNSHNLPKQKTELEKEHKERQLAESNGQVYSPPERKIYSLEEVFKIIMKKQVDGKIGYLLNNLGFNRDTAENIYRLLGSKCNWIANKIIEEHKLRYGIDESNPDEFPVAYITANDLNNYYWLTNISDWINVGLNGNIENIRDLTLAELDSKASEWHDSLQAGEAKINYVEKNKIIIDMRKNGEGYYWVELGKNSDDEEAERMGHCGTSYGSILYSLRSYKNINNEYTLNDSHVTVAIQGGNIVQSKGKQNSKPKEEYHKYILELLKYKDKNGQPLVYQIGPSEYDVGSDFSIEDLDDNNLIDLYKHSPRLFNIRDKACLFLRGILKKQELYEAGRQIIEIDPDDLDKFLNEGDFNLSSVYRDYQINFDFNISIKEISKYISDENKEFLMKEFESNDILEIINDYDIVLSCVYDSYTNQINDQYVNAIMREVENKLSNYGKIISNDFNGIKINVSLFDIVSPYKLVNEFEINDINLSDFKHIIMGLYHQGVVRQIRIDNDAVESRVYFDRVEFNESLRECLNANKGR